MLEIVTSKGIVPNSDCSYDVFTCIYAWCYSSLLIVEFSLNDCEIGANRKKKLLYFSVML